MEILILGLKKSPYKISCEHTEYRYVYLGQNLVKNGHHTTIVFESPKIYLPKTYLGINLKAIPKLDFVSIIKLILSKQKIDLVHITSLDLAWTLFWFKMFRPTTKLIMEANNYSFQKWDVDGKLDKIHSAHTSAKLADQIIVPNRLLQKYFIDILQKDAHIISIPKGISSSTSEQYILTKYHLQKRNFLYTHSLPNSGNSQLKLLLIDYQKLNLSIPLVISGHVKTDLKTKFKSSNILFIGTLKTSQQYTLASNAKIFLDFHPIEENQALLLQALLSNTPLILLQHPLYKTIAGRKAMYVYPDNLASMKTVLDFSLQNYDLISHVAARLAASSKNTYTLDNYYHKFLYLYVNTIAKSKDFYTNRKTSTIQIPFKN
jgi:glycosyltransferase involved in cell wall biosynthesis